MTRSGSHTTFHWDMIAAERILVAAPAEALVVEIANRGADEARAIVPVNTGYSRDHIISGRSAPVGGVACAFFGSDSPVWHLVEFGSVNNPAYRTLTQAAERVAMFRPDAKK